MTENFVQREMSFVLAGFAKHTASPFHFGLRSIVLTGPAGDASRG